MAQTKAQLVDYGTAVASSVPTNGPYLSAANTVAISTNGSQRVTVNSSGNVGIGTTSPGAPLHVRASAGHNLWFYQTSSGIFDVNAVNDAASANVNLRLTSDNLLLQTGGSERARLDSSGRLLVGTSSYTGNGKLAIAGGTGTNIALFDLRYNSTRPTTADVGLVEIRFGSADQTSNNAYAKIEAVTDGASSSDTDLPGRLVFSVTRDGQASPTEAMRISNTGETGVFTQAGSTVFVARSAATAGTSDRLFAGINSATGNVPGGNISFQVFTNGNVQNTNNSYGAISDAKLKENIVDATSQWADIKAIQVRKYNFKEGQTHTQIGLIAQEVELVSPGLVSESPDRDEEGNDLGTTTKSVNYSVLYMKAVKALQEAMERIEQLEAEMTAVKAQLA